MFRSVTRCVSRSDEHFTKFKTIAISYFFVRETVFCTAFVARINLRRFQPRAQFARPAYKIGMNMRFENMRDREADFARHVHINIDICSWVEDCSHSFVIIADKIGKLGDPLGLDGFKH